MKLGASLETVMRNQKVALATAVENVVQACQDEGAVLWADDAARKLQLEHASSGIATRQIADSLALEAIRAGVAMQLPCRSDFNEE